MVQKKNDLSKTGYKGIGFKSVFGYSNKVLIYTNGEYFRFDSSFKHEWKWKGTQEEWEQATGRMFEYSWQLIPILTETSEVQDEINQYIKEVGANVATIISIKKIEQIKESILELSDKLNMFLFLKNISELNIDIYNLIHQIEIKHVNNNLVALYKNEKLNSMWMLNTLDLRIFDTIKASLRDEQNPPEKLLEADAIELTLAAKVNLEQGIIQLQNEERLLYSYLPTDETKYNLPVLVNTSFLTTSNRENLHINSKWNQWLFKSISIELFKWIAYLVTIEVGYEAYKLIPNETFPNDLGTKFNEGIREAIETVPFIVSKENKLLRVKDTIVDFTFLSEKSFVGESVIKEHLNGNNKYFAQDTSFARKFEELGALAFNWKDIPSFLDSTSFKQYLTPEKNILLIKHLKSTSDSEKVKKINTKFLKSLSFIKDHRNNIKSPEQVCFPSADDVNWNNLDTELSFVHEEILNWLNNDSEHRAWLENLGVVERSDITYITQTIIPNIDTYITNDNAIEAIQNLFRLYRKGDLNENLIKQLSSIKLQTQKGYLCPAKDCFFSNYYAPNLKIENILEPDIFVNELYCPQNADKEEWKRFFKFLGVKENIEIQEFAERIPNNQLIDRGFNEHYFSEEDKKFTPWINTFTAYSYQNISTFELLNFTEKNSKFSFIFWQNVLRNELPDAIVSPSTAFWGDTGRPGEKTGNKVENYIPWYICYIECIPTLDDGCKTAPDTFLNTEEIRKIADKYLPIFDGPDLSPNW